VAHQRRQLDGRVNDAATQKVAAFWGGLVEEGVIDNTPMYTPEWNAALNDGTQVGWVSAVWGPGVLEGSAKATLGKWKVAQLPQWDTAQPATGNWGGSATSVTTQSKHPGQAARFVSWLNSDPAAVKALVTQANVYPAAEGASAALTQPPAFFADQPDFYTLAGQAAKITRPFTYGRTSTWRTAPTTTPSARPPRPGRPAPSPQRSPRCSRPPWTT